MKRRIATVAAALLLAGAALSTTASARDSFSVSIGVPGFAVGYGSPAYYEPSYYAPSAYYTPYDAPPVAYYPAPAVAYGPRFVYARPYYYHRPYFHGYYWHR